MPRDYDLSPRDPANEARHAASGHAVPSTQLGSLETKQGPVSLLGWSMALVGGAALWAGIVALLS